MRKAANRSLKNELRLHLRRCPTRSSTLGSAGACSRVDYVYFPRVEHMDDID
jgi:hypothetical protein